MSRLKTFLIYVILILAFIGLSYFLENNLIKNMYYDMTGTIDDVLDYDGKQIDLDIKVSQAKSTNVNGYIDLTVTNNSKTYIDEAYVKVLLYSKSDVHAVTKYMEIKGLSGGETKTYRLRFKGSFIKTYAISAEKEFPNKDYIINFFGYDVDVRNVFGMDLSKYINKDSFVSFGSSVFHTIRIIITSIPAWAWFWAWMIIAGVW